MANVLILKFPYSSTYGGGEKHTTTLVEGSQHSFFLASSCPVLMPEFSKRDWHAEQRWGGTEPVTLLAALWLFITWPFVLANMLRIVWMYKKQHNIEVLYCLSLTEKVLLTPWARLLGIRSIWIEHNQIRNWLKLNPWRVFYVLWSFMADIVTVAHEVKKQIHALGVPNSRIHVIYNSADTEHIPFLEAKENTENFNISFIGRIAPEKGLRELFQAAVIAKQQIPQLTLTIVGDGPQADEAQEFVQEYHAAKFTNFAGFQKNVVEWIEKTHAVVLPSTNESFGMILIEAISAGRPVIATRLGDVAYVVGDHGIVVEPGNVEELAKAIVRMHDNYETYTNIAKAGRKRVLDEFGQTRMIKEYDDIITSLA